MDPTPVPAAALGAPEPTSRSTFRFLAKELGATNREADTLRRILLDAWDDGLAARLRELDWDDPDGTGGVESRLAVWLEPVDVAAFDAAGVSGAVVERLRACVIDAGSAGSPTET